MKKKTALIGAALLVIAALAVYGRGFLVTAPAAAEGAREPATLRVGKSAIAETVLASGTIKPKVGAEVKVGSRISGVVQRLSVGIGDRVEKGQLLAILDDADQRARRDVLLAELAAKQAELVYADGELRRLEQVPQLAAIRIDDSRRNVEVRRADVARTRALIRESEISLSYSRITAPVAGTIASVSTYEGETVAASFAAPTFVTILDLDRLEIQSYVDETDIARVATGTRATFRVDAYPSVELHGVVRAILPKPQLINNVVTYVVLVDIQGKHDLQLRPEMTTRVSFEFGSAAEVVSVPRSAVLRDGQQSYVVVREPPGWRKRQVTTGTRTASSFEIASGLAEGETVLADASTWNGSGGGN